MQSLSDMMKDRRPEEPPQVSALKKYMRDKHHVDSKVSLNQSYYRLIVPSAALAGRLRMESPQIITECELDKRLVIQIGPV